MALLTQKNVGGNTVSSSSASLSATVNIADFNSSNYTTETLATSGLPNIVFWFLGRANAPAEVPFDSYQIVFKAAVRTVNGQPDFKDVVTVFAPASDTPLLYSFEFPCIAIQARITRPNDQDNDWDNGFTYTLSAYGP
jgi:hypothetical protein